MAQQPGIGNRAQIGVGVAVGADLDAGRGHRPKLLQRVGGKTMARHQVVRKRLRTEYVLERDKVGTSDAVFD